MFYLLIGYGRLKIEEAEMTTLENRRLRGDMIETWKILNGREDIDSSQFFSNGKL